MFNHCTSCLAAALVLVSVSANASETIDEIVVTADFRERSQTDVPFSVSVMPADFVKDVSVQHFEELVNLVPNMNWSGDGHRARYFQIRGVGELEQYQGAPNPSIGFLIDDIDFSGIGTIATLFDIGSVEVLRGPQGSRYGANALGGLIYVRSATPTVARIGRLEVTVADDNALSLGAAFGGAIGTTDTATYRISAQRYTSNGFRDNPYLNRDDSNGRDELTLRGQLHFKPSDVFAAKLALLYSNVDNGYDAFALDNSYTVLSDKPGQDAQESIGASLRLDWDFADALTLTSISSMATSNIDFSFDADWGNSDSWAPVTYDYVSLNVRERDTLSQEFRLANDQWLMGAYAMRLQDRVLTVNRGDYYDPFYDFSDSLNDRFGSDYEASNVALFGQYIFSLSEKTTVTSGLRIEHRSTKYSDTEGLANAPSESMWGGDISIGHAIGDRSSVYATLSRGYKAGGFNLGAVPAGKRDFDAEQLWTFEVGVKSTMLDQRLLLNASVFHNRRDDQQSRTSTQLVPGDPASFVFFTDNTGRGESYGLETEIRFFVTDQLEIYSNIGLLDASLYSGRSQAHAPRFTFSGGVVFRQQDGFFGRLDVTAKDAFYFDVSHDQKSQSYELLNARVGFENERWRVSVWGRNLFDTEYAVRGFFFGNEPPDFPDALYTRLGDPRQYGLTLERRF
jgi:iron complex outermembrane recepter protein